MDALLVVPGRAFCGPPLSFDVMQMNRERFTLIPETHLLLVRDEEILLLKRYNTGYEDGKYSVIAGHIEAGETATSAMAREAQEEAGIEIRRVDLTLAHMMHRLHLDERMSLFFVASRWTGTPQNKEPHKCDDLKWFLLNQLPENIVPYVSQAIRHYLNQTVYSEFGWDRTA